MSDTQTIGLIGLDTSHVTTFARILNDEQYEHHVPGGRIVAGYPGAVDDFELSHSRVEGFTKQLREEYGVAILDSPEAVAERVDLVFITSVDGRTHRRFMDQVAPARKPVFVDKPLACDIEDAVHIFEAGQTHGIPVTSCSCHRYSELLQQSLQRDRQGIKAADLFGPMPVHDQLPGFYYYGIHQIEMAVAILGPHAAQVQVNTSTSHDVATIHWHDGRIATIHGQRDVHRGFGVTLHRADGAEMLDMTRNTRPNHAAMLEKIIASLPRGRSDVPMEESLAIIAIIEAANRSRENQGEPTRVNLPAAGI